MPEDNNTAGAAPQAEPRRRGGKRVKADSNKMELYDWIQCVVGALVAGILIFMFVARVVNVSGGSMNPTLFNTDKIVTSNLFYKPKNGDVIVFQTDSYGPEPLVKRIIATEGQTIDIDFDAGIVYLDGVPLDEPYVAAPVIDREDFVGPMTVPEGCIFVMGDNRNNSTDSRTSSIGMVDTRCIIGKVLFVLLPANIENVGRDWSRVGSIY